MDQHRYQEVEQDAENQKAAQTIYGTVQDEKDWKFTDHGEVRPLSRDGSIHATDEVFNSASHLIALMFSVLGMTILVSRASAMGEPWKIVSFSIYGASLIFLFGASTMHHSVDSTARVEEWLRIIDYVAIYPLIAGTFTPLCLVFFHDTTTGWSFFGVVWALSLVGVYLTLVHFRKVPRWFSMTCYVTLGWLGAFMSFSLYDKIHVTGLALLAAGGLFYTIGGAIFTMEKPNPIPGKFGFHEIWHIFVILGALSHWILMFVCVLPWEPSHLQP